MNTTVSLIKLTLPPKEIIRSLIENEDYLKLSKIIIFPADNQQNSYYVILSAEEDKKVYINSIFEKFNSTHLEARHVGELKHEESENCLYMIRVFTFNQDERSTVENFYTDYSSEKGITYKILDKCNLLNMQRTIDYNFLELTEGKLLVFTKHRENKFLDEINKQLGGLEKNESSLQIQIDIEKLVQELNEEANIEESVRAYHELQKNFDSALAKLIRVITLKDIVISHGKTFFFKEKQPAKATSETNVTHIADHISDVNKIYAEYILELKRKDGCGVYTPDELGKLELGNEPTSQNSLQIGQRP